MSLGRIHARNGAGQKRWLDELVDAAVEDIRKVSLRWTLSSLQVSRSEALMAQWAAPPSEPANSVFLRLGTDQSLDGVGVELDAVVWETRSGINDTCKR